MAALLYALGAVALAAGLAGLVLPAVPGSALLLAGVVLVAWAGDFTRVGWPTIAVEAALAAAILATDWVAGALGAKAFGASRWAFAGALLGFGIGVFFGLPGILLGPALGAFALELLKDPDLARAARAGAGVVVGAIVGGAVKVALGFALLGILVLALVL